MEGSNTSITFWGEKNVNLDPSYLKDTILPVFTSFIEIFALDYNMPKLDIVSVPFMENYGSPGLITIM